MPFAHDFGLLLITRRARRMAAFVPRLREGGRCLMQLRWMSRHQESSQASSCEPSSLCLQGAETISISPNSFRSHFVHRLQQVLTLLPLHVVRPPPFTLALAGFLRGSVCSAYLPAGMLICHAILIHFVYCLFGATSTQGSVLVAFPVLIMPHGTWPPAQFEFLLPLWLGIIGIPCS